MKEANGIDAAREKQSDGVESRFLATDSLHPVASILGDARIST